MPWDCHQDVVLVLHFSSVGVVWVTLPYWNERWIVLHRDPLDTLAYERTTWRQVMREPRIRAGTREIYPCRREYLLFHYPWLSLQLPVGLQYVRRIRRMYSSLIAGEWVLPYHHWECVPSHDPQLTPPHCVASERGVQSRRQRVIYFWLHLLRMHWAHSIHSSLPLASLSDASGRSARR